MGAYRKPDYTIVLDPDDDTTVQVIEQPVYTSDADPMKETCPPTMGCLQMVPVTEPAAQAVIHAYNGSADTDPSIGFSSAGGAIVAAGLVGNTFGFFNNGVYVVIEDVDDIIWEIRVWWGKTPF